MIRIALVIVAGLLVAGCASFGSLFDAFKPKPPAQPKGALFCDVTAATIPGGLKWHEKDTRGTKEQADKLNAAGAKLCGW